MTTDLKVARDHPATLLESSDAPSKPAEPFSDFEFTEREYNSGVSDAAEFLRNYEYQHGVTFAALDNDVLQSVRNSYARIAQAVTLPQANMEREEFIHAVAELLGLSA